MLRALDLQLPPGLDLTRVDTDNEQVLSRIQGIRWLITPDPPLTEDDLTRARARLASGPLEYRRGTKKRIRDLSSIITSFDPAANGGALVSCRFGQEGTAKPEEILIHLLGMEQQELHGCRVLREGWNLAEIQQK